MKFTNRPVIYLIAIIGLLTIGCTKKNPQLPANKSNSVDTLMLSVQTANQILIEGEDSLLHNYVTKNYRAMKRSDTGLWYLPLTSEQHGEKVKDLETVTITYEILSLDSLVLDNKSKSIVLGKKQVINGIEEGVRMMNKGDKMLLIIPWYLAYGMKGDGEKIAPYTSVMVKLQLNK